MSLLFNGIICFRVLQVLEEDTFSMMCVIALCFESQNKHLFTEREKMKENIHTTNSVILICFIIHRVFTSSCTVVIKI